MNFIQMWQTNIQGYFYLSFRLYNLIKLLKIDKDKLRKLDLLAHLDLLNWCLNPKKLILNYV